MRRAAAVSNNSGDYAWIYANRSTDILVGSLVTLSCIDAPCPVLLIDCPELFCQVHNVRALPPLRWGYAVLLIRPFVVVFNGRDTVDHGFVTLKLVFVV